MKARLIDVGSTNIKSALFDTKSNVFSEAGSTPFPSGNKKDAPFYEINVQEVEQSVRSLWGAGHDAVFVCSQMHGYVLMKGSRAVSGYISWKDKRAGLKDLPAPLPPGYGVNMKANLPRASIEYMKNYMPQALGEADTFCTLASYLAYRFCGENASHITDLAASGFYRVESGIPDPYFRFMPEAHLNVEKIGQYGDCDVYSPCGDQQTAVLGSGAEDSVILNIGTASQMCCIGDGIISGDFENRPYFYGRTLYTVTGLPGGELLEKQDDENMFVTLFTAWREALRKLPRRERITVTGGAVKYKRELITRVLDEIGVTYTFSSGNETMKGLAVMATEMAK